MLTLNSINFCEEDARLREKVNAFLVEHWGATSMALRGKLIDLKETRGIVALRGCEIVGLLTYLIHDGSLEIMSLDSILENKGIGTRLINMIKEKAAAMGIKKIILITTNDNINAIKFYQKCGFDMTKIYRNAVDKARMLKPSIPLVGDFEIPIKHEIEFKIML